ncbi:MULTISPECIES: GNAT family N-acetyltransferase [Kribbella]|jgi:predicted GNAT family acetyltransferase|uniref:N-acetyltransferase n=1 Tax=Kribbella karoonensis TaxID=324851 RepID=A0ABP4Q1E5_9ACTN
MTDQRFEVQNRPGESRYVLIDTESGEVIGEEDYVDVENQRVLFHTGVSDAYSGQGLASQLVRAAVDDVIANGYAIVPVCPYVAAWLPKHPEYADHVTKPRPEHLKAVAAHEKK